MELSVEKDDRKAGRVRKTHKQLVQTVYPESYYGTDTCIWVYDRWFGSNQWFRLTPITCDLMGYQHENARKAWKQAWEIIQQQMLTELEK